MGWNLVEVFTDPLVDPGYVWIVKKAPLDSLAGRVPAAVLHLRAGVAKEPGEQRGRPSALPGTGGRMSAIVVGADCPLCTGWAGARITTVHTANQWECSVPGVGVNKHRVTATVLAAVTSVSTAVPAVAPPAPPVSVQIGDKCPICAHPSVGSNLRTVQAADSQSRSWICTGTSGINYTHQPPDVQQFNAGTAPTRISVTDPVTALATFVGTYKPVVNSTFTVPAAHSGPPTKPATKKIDDYPHVCPRCGGPAYIGMGPADCKAKCDQPRVVAEGACPASWSKRHDWEPLSSMVGAVGSATGQREYCISCRKTR